MKRIMLFLAALLLSATAWATSLTCSIDRSFLMWTGRTEVEYGQMLFEHKCLARGHLFWLTSDQMNQ